MSIRVRVYLTVNLLQRRDRGAEPPSDVLPRRPVTVSRVLCGVLFHISPSLSSATEPKAESESTEQPEVRSFGNPLHRIDALADHVLEIFECLTELLLTVFDFAGGRRLDFGIRAVHLAPP